MSTRTMHLLGISADKSADTCHLASYSQMIKNLMKVGEEIKERRKNCWLVIRKK